MSWLVRSWSQPALATRRPLPSTARVWLPLAAVLLTACAAGAPQVTPLAPAAPPVASAPATQVIRATPRAPTPPAVELAEQIRRALTRSRWPAGFDGRRSVVGAPEWRQDLCLDVSARNAARCTYGSPTATRAVALVGDSVAVGWLPGLRRAPSLRDARIHVLTQRQCPNLRGLVPTGCEAHHYWVLKQVRRLRPELVVLSARYQGGQTWPQWQAGTLRMLKGITPYAKRVVVLAPPPDSEDVRACFQRGIPPAHCGRAVSVDWRSYAYAEWKAAGTRARFVDPRPWFCVSERCPALVGSLPVTFDGRHLTGAYAARIGPLLSAALS